MKKVVMAPDISDPMYVFSSAQRPAAELASNNASTASAGAAGRLRTEARGGEEGRQDAREHVPHVNVQGNPGARAGTDARTQPMRKAAARVGSAHAGAVPVQQPPWRTCSGPDTADAAAVASAADAAGGARGRVTGRAELKREQTPQQRAAGALE
jgi:hypothetical protein